MPVADDEPVVVTATRRAMRELADGTLRVQIDIDPPHRAAFLKLFSEIDCKVALARMLPEYLVGSEGGGNAAPAGEPDAAPATVSLCTLACMWCRDPAFQDWLELVYPQEWNDAETGGGEWAAASVVRRVCGVSTRRELDTNPEAAAIFNQQIRTPWLDSQ